MIKVAIAGGSGYTAGELIRLLINHPQVEIVALLSSSRAGEAISDTHRDLFGETNLKFISSLDELERDRRPDLLFLTLAHGLSKGYLEQLELTQKCKVIDMGNDFRLDSEFADGKFIYGLSELNREKLKGAQYVANPGCFATAIVLSLLPLASIGELKEEIHLHAITGSTGAGRSLSESTHFSYRESNISLYKPFKHQHIGEIVKVLKEVNGNQEPPQINFIPIRGDFTRGIFVSLYTKAIGKESVEEMEQLYREYYRDSPFVKISETPLSLKEVVNTNRALIHIERHNGYWHLTSIIDNLLKGASGQAIQNMNLLFNFEENLGLKLKGSAF